MNDQSNHANSYQLLDRYENTHERVFLTGTQALVRIMLDQSRRDKSAGMNTAGFVSGYHGSPLGALDKELWAANSILETHNVTFMPAVNEDLGATAILGAQQASLDPECTVDGVFSMWYGKGPGVDRSGDALRHGNAYGSAEKGDVLVVAGDDHGCVSSSMPHQSDVAFMSWFMPVLNPSNVGEFLEFGEFGIALSRFSGTWVGFKAISETVESGQSVALKPDRDFVIPDIEMPKAGLHVRNSDLPSVEIETRIEAKLAAVEAFVEANPIDRRIYDIPDARFGIVTTGKGHLDLMEALRLLGLNETACRKLGIDIYKVGMVWPLARRDALAFVRDKDEVLVIEEKRGIIESQFKEYFYDWPGDKPQKMVGKHRAVGDPLLPWTGELSPRLLMPVLAERLHAFFPDEDLPARARYITHTTPPKLSVPGASRKPYFCSGCPHNISTKVPEGSKAASGIGCHVMASWMDRKTVGYAQMGGEGIPHAVSSKFSGNKHIFQNLGEGTWYHSGSLAIRQAVAAKANITYKILYNDAVAMTGGQPVDGPISVQSIAQICRAEGISRIALVSDDIQKFKHADFPNQTTFHAREKLDQVQLELREIPGVTVLIYEQACATEKRRRRKRGALPDPKKFAYINPLVCEGCGDCSLESNCLSIEPLETPLGRKRKINQSTCNKDFSCLNGFCPSFVTIEGTLRRDKHKFNPVEFVSEIPEPSLPELKQPFDLLVTGVGGTGVVTLGALITMAAHLEGKGASVLDFTGFAQKFGTVLSYIRIGNRPDSINQVRVDKACADAVIGGDIVVSSSPNASQHYSKNSAMVLNLAEMPTGDLVLHRDANLRIRDREDTIRNAVDESAMLSFDANTLADKIFGNTVFANTILLGSAWQNGMVPVGLKAIQLNGVEIEKNLHSFHLGRIVSHAGIETITNPSTPEQETLDDLIARLASLLTEHSNSSWASEYREAIVNFQAQTNVDFSEQLTRIAAQSLFKLIAYKDEYEVARLHTSAEFDDLLCHEFNPGFKVKYHLAPPVLSVGNRVPRKIKLGSWAYFALKLLRSLGPLRRTQFDPFGHSRDRKEEESLIQWYRKGLLDLAPLINSSNQHHAKTFLNAPSQFRGFGHVKAKSIAATKPRADFASCQVVRKSD